MSFNSREKSRGYIGRIILFSSRFPSILGKWFCNSESTKESWSLLKMFANNQAFSHFSQNPTRRLDFSVIQYFKQNTSLPKLVTSFLIWETFDLSAHLYWIKKSFCFQILGTTNPVLLVFPLRIKKQFSFRSVLCSQDRWWTKPRNQA